eukprot:3323693-Karenia_brevis.AAC.1
MLSHSWCHRANASTCRRNHPLHSTPGTCCGPQLPDAHNSAGNHAAMPALTSAIRQDLQAMSLGRRFLLLLRPLSAHSPPT